jgi:molecular chaperone DnaJ
VFGDIFGGARRGGRSQVFRGADLRYDLELDLNQAVFGTTVEIDVPKLSECETCKGSGAAKGHSPVQCETCHGSGQVRCAGFFQCSRPVRAAGAARFERSPASAAGRGTRKRGHSAVKVPAGRYRRPDRLSGEGEADATAVRP